MSFIGREREIQILTRYLNKDPAALVVMRGRRRIGKSRLIEEFAKDYKSYFFSGIPLTDKTTAQSQRNEFTSQLSRQGFPLVNANDWNNLFWLLADKVRKGRVIIVFDEISWMGSKDPDFLGKLKNAWDLHFKKNPKLMLILCGSASSWIEKNILSSTGFLGRITYTMNVEELPLEVCRQFGGVKAKNISAMEMFKVLSVIGGIPRYLEEIDANLSAEENIKNLCFTKGGLLVNEFENIFSNVFLRDSKTYKKIVEILVTGIKTFKEICDSLKLTHSGRVLEYLEELELAGFIKRDFTWHFNTGTDARLSCYRLSDNYLRFYLKYVEKNKKKIERNSYDFVSLSSLSAWNTVIALQFENLVLNNRQFIWEMLQLKQEDIVSENPFFQTKTTKQLGCQIDYLIQTRFDTLFVCEVKFSRYTITHKIITEIQNKIDRLKKPKHFSCRPVLIHIGEVDNSVIKEGYFYKVIDFSKVIK